MMIMMVVVVVMVVVFGEDGEDKEGGIIGISWSYNKCPGHKLNSSDMIFHKFLHQPLLELFIHL